MLFHAACEHSYPALPSVWARGPGGVENACAMQKSFVWRAQVFKGISLTFGRLLVVFAIFTFWDM
jgi:hypothetical protein